MPVMKMIDPKPVRIDDRIPWFADVRRVLSPMAGVTDRSFREVCRRFGADLAFCEFTAAKGLVYENRQTWDLVDIEDEPGRVGVQIFGEDPDSMAAAARLLGEWDPDVLDINFGCPAKKVVKKCGGSALLADLPRLEAIVRKVIDASGVPVRAKIRTGWDEASVNYREVGGLLQDLGCCWVTMHGRTRSQKFRDTANIAMIADLVETLDIPVIGNGDVVDGEGYLRMARAVMIGRGAMGNPWIFAEMKAAAEGRPHAGPDLPEIFEVIRLHVGEIAARKGERYGSQLVRKHVVRYLRGFPGAAVMRRRLFETETGDEMLRELERIRREYGLPGSLEGEVTRP